MYRDVTRGRRQGFTLTELLTVIGLVTLLGSLLMPVMSKVRAASNNTSCLSNLRQMGVAWTMYVSESHGRLPHYLWGPPTATPQTAWYGYWTGILEKNGVKGHAILCPAAEEETPFEKNRGFGNVAYAWSGKYSLSTNAIRFNPQRYRVSSYGYNSYLTAGKPLDKRSNLYCINSVKDAGNVPAFMDCAYADAEPKQYSDAALTPVPPDLRGETLDEGSPDHWRFLLGRHGRGINVCMADGSARWVRLEDTYMLKWKGDWQPYRLRLPGK
jgi:prepilin-type processing-associated H-X9-DG protein/prepilin-type N-terminal cleavage/methylation domain-containing protein